MSDQNPNQDSNTTLQNNKQKLLLIASALIVLLVITLFIIGIIDSSNSKDPSQIQYILYVESDTDGYGIAGQYLKGIVVNKEFNIQVGDVVDEKLELNDPDTNTPAIKVLSLNENDVKLEIIEWGKWDTKTLKYGEEYNFVPGYTVIADGPVLDITLKIKKY